MKTTDSNDIKIVHTTKDDLNQILSLFDSVLLLQGKNGYKVWNAVDRVALEKDIEENRNTRSLRATTSSAFLLLARAILLPGAK
jgi:hypothetical protein